jgi:adenylate cyclase class IV
LRILRCRQDSLAEARMPFQPSQPITVPSAMRSDRHLHSFGRRVRARSEAVLLTYAGEPNLKAVSHPDLPRRNIELKATDPEPAWSVDQCHRIGATDAGSIFQRDTYFHVARGGLKLRDESPGHPHLIQFERRDQPEQRTSAYRIIPVDEGVVLRAALEAALGIRGEVEKRRHLFLWRQVRIHLDEVTGLGTFIEFEAVAPAGSDLCEEHQLVAQLRDLFGVNEDRLCALGYASQLGI